jgi:hypothetical protein
MAYRKFQNGDRVVGHEEAPASFRERAGKVADYQGRGGYGVRFDDRPEIIEYVNSHWMVREGAVRDTNRAGER